jgi:hypothetical protein
VDHRPAPGSGGRGALELADRGGVLAVVVGTGGAGGGAAAVGTPAPLPRHPRAGPAGIRRTFVPSGHTRAPTPTARKVARPATRRVSGTARTPSSAAPRPTTTRITAVFRPAIPTMPTANLVGTRPVCPNSSQDDGYLGAEGSEPVFHGDRPLRRGEPRFALNDEKDEARTNLAPEERHIDSPE